MPESEYQRIFARFVARVEEASEEALQDSHTAHVGLEGVDPTPGLMAWAESARADLEELKRRRETHIQAMYDQLEALWRRLGVPDAGIDGFVEAQRGSTDATVKSYEEELERMLELAIASSVHSDWSHVAAQHVTDWRLEYAPLLESDQVPMRPERLCAELTDLVTELVVPLARREDAEVDEILARYRSII